MYVRVIIPFGRLGTNRVWLAVLLMLKLSGEGCLRQESAIVWRFAAEIHLWHE